MAGLVSVTVGGLMPGAGTPVQGTPLTVKAVGDRTGWVPLPTRPTVSDAPVFRAEFHGRLAAVTRVPV